MKILTTAATGSPEWLAARKGKIGGNMAADILGCGRRSPFQAWAELTGKVEPEDLSKKPYIRRGNLLEPVILRGFAEDANVLLMPSPGLIQHDKLPYLAGTPDALYQRKDGALGIVDAKSVGFYRMSEWKAGIPLRTQVQVLFYAALHGGCDVIAAAAMPTDEDEEQEPILWDEQPVNLVQVHTLLDRLQEFWDKHVETDIPPDANPLADRKTLKQMFLHDDGSSIQGTEQMQELWTEIEELRPIIKEHTDKKEELTAELEQLMGNHAYADFGSFRLKYVTESRKGYEVQPWTGRVLRKVKA